MTETDDERERNKHINQLGAWVRPVAEEVQILGSPTERQQIENALYAFGERGLIYDIDSVDYHTAMQIWAIVESARRTGFPDELRM